MPLTSFSSHGRTDGASGPSPPTGAAYPLCDTTLSNAPCTGVMGGDQNTVHLITAQGEENWPTMAKDAVAIALARRIAQFFDAGFDADFDANSDAE